VSAVGHEVDFTICDFVADLRAATPSAAAELTLPDKADLGRRVTALSTRLDTSVSAVLTRRRTRLASLSSRRVLSAPEAVYTRRKERLDTLGTRLHMAADRHVTAGRQDLRRLCAQLSALSPLGVLGRGYALVQGEDGHVITGADRLSVGDTVTLRFADSRATATVTNTETQSDE